MGVNLRDRNHKSSKELIQYLIKSAGYGSNLLLNVGPMPNGQIQPKHKESLKDIGNWLSKYGETIYKTKQGPIQPREGVVSTQLENKIFLHFINSDKNIFRFESFYEKVKSLKYFDSDANVKYSNKNNLLIVELEDKKRDSIDTIVTLVLK